MPVVHSDQSDSEIEDDSKPEPGAGGGKVGGGDAQAGKDAADVGRMLVDDEAEVDNDAEDGEEDDEEEGEEDDEEEGEEDDEEDDEDDLDEEESEEEEEKQPPKKRKIEPKQPVAKASGTKKAGSESATLTKYILPHGAHRLYAVERKLILHEGEKPVSVESGGVLGKTIVSKSIGAWNPVKVSNVFILGGKDLSGNDKCGPFVTMVCPGSEKTDDAVCLRPIPPAIYPRLVVKWKREIENKYGSSEERFQAKMKQFKPVLKWKANMLGGPKLSPELVSSGFHVLNRKLNTARVIPKEAIATKPPSKAEPDNASVAASDNTAGLTGSKRRFRVVAVGPADSTKTFEFDGVLYASILVE